MRILVVDDDDIVQSMIKNVLVQSGYEVELASDGKQALDVLRQKDCRLVISDWEMPVMDGLELCQAVRSGDFPGYIYFILLTGHQDHEHLVEGLTTGADDFISKPFSPSELRVRIRAGERILSLETRDIAIFALAKLTESRDPETGAHLERVQNYCRVIARHLYNEKKFEEIVNPEYIRLIYITSPLHDIGKVGIPDGVLLKPGRLTEDEFEIMKTHTTIGAETLDAALKEFPNARFLQMARDIALSHHERYDGGGYPHQLAGENIPLSGRIVSLADVYDALTSKRVYKEDYAHDVAQSIIMEEAGKQFDPVIIDAFEKNMNEFVAIRERYHERDPVIV
jgi:putative two-component system response regulator